MKDLAMHREHEVIEEIPGLYRIVGLHPLRRTRGVAFDCLPMGIVPRIDALDRVIHETSALSPGPVGDVEKPWYMHPHQDDNLMVMYGTRMVDLYKKGHGKLESFVVTSDRIERIGGFVHNGPAMLVWPRAVFHRVQSGKEGSASINLAVHYDGFEIRTNFTIYDLDTNTGVFRAIRQGHEDQF